MKVVLTGATGLVGSGVLTALLDGGHEVTALVRSESSAKVVSAAGATAAQGDLTDDDWVRGQFHSADGAIHTASPGDASSADFDASVARAAAAAFARTGRPYVHTGGVWVRGAGQDITEQTPPDPPALTAWRPAVEQIVRDADGVRAIIIEPGIVYGGGQGLAALLTHPAEDGTYRLIGDGSQHWTTVGVDDLADLYVRALTDERASGHYIGVSAGNPTVREIAEAAADAAGAEVVAETPQQSRDRLFAPLVDALLLDQQAGAARAHDELGWHPAGPSLLEEIAAGNYS